MSAYTGKTALITGASRGIGYQIARLCASEGANVILVSRDAERLERAAQDLATEFGVDARPLVADLSRPGSAAELWDRITAKGLPVDILVNNAGIGAYGEFLAISTDRTRDMRQLNIVSFIELMHLAATSMAARGWGRILTVASVAGFHGMPYMAEYGATKAFVVCLSEATRVELASSGVVVTCLAPGPTETDFFSSAGTRMLKTPGRKTPDQVAKAGFEAMLAGRPLVVPGVMNQLMVFVGRITPRAAYARIVARVLKNR